MEKEATVRHWRETLQAVGKWVHGLVKGNEDTV
jgi:hypothetical protein